MGCNAHMPCPRQLQDHSGTLSNRHGNPIVHHSEVHHSNHSNPVTFCKPSVALLVEAVVALVAPPSVVAPPSAVALPSAVAAPSVAAPSAAPSSFLASACPSEIAAAASYQTVPSDFPCAVPSDFPCAAPSAQVGHLQEVQGVGALVKQAHQIRLQGAEVEEVAARQLWLFPPLWMRLMVLIPMAHSEAAVVECSWSQRTSFASLACLASAAPCSSSPLGSPLGAYPSSCQQASVAASCSAEDSALEQACPAVVEVSEVR